jgi:hypothetical protein
VLFSRHCPLFDTRLSLGMRVLYTSVTWCYITNTIAVPLSVTIPFIALTAGYFPLVITPAFAVAATAYFVVSQVRAWRPGHRVLCGLTGVCLAPRRP